MFTVLARSSKVRFTRVESLLARATARPHFFGGLQDRVLYRTCYPIGDLTEHALIDPKSFEAAVDSILEGQRVDFGAKDRLQLGMLVIEYIEARIPMRPCEVWVEDFLANREEYIIYTHTLHRERRLP